MVFFQKNGMQGNLRELESRIDNIRSALDSRQSAAGQSLSLFFVFVVFD
jgi:hypothetical protein